MPRRPKPDLTFQGPRDVAYLRERDLERYHYQQQRHAVRFIQQGASQASGGISDLYGERPPGGDLKYSIPVVMPIYVKLSMNEDELNRFGADSPRDALVVFSVAVLIDLGIDYSNPLQGPKIGDVVDYITHDPNGHESREQWRINNTSTWDYWGNTQVPLHIVCTVSRKFEALEN